jgi:hypothetical protein
LSDSFSGRMPVPQPESPPPAQPQLSADGHWLWDGTQWVPAKSGRDLRMSDSFAGAQRAKEVDAALPPSCEKYAYAATGEQALARERALQAARQEQAPKRGLSGGFWVFAIVVAIIAASCGLNDNGGGSGGRSLMDCDKYATSVAGGQAFEGSATYNQAYEDCERINDAR